MIINKISLHPFKILLNNNQERFGVLVHLQVDQERNGWGEIAPLPNWSKETLEECLQQFDKKRNEILKIDWNIQNFLEKLIDLQLLPAVTFGLESALLALLAPLNNITFPASALFMGSYEEILFQAELRQSEGYTSAKLKVGHLKFSEAANLIHHLKDRFRLRIDVNRAWSTVDSLQFFSQFSLNTFDYVEEPFQNPDDLPLFSHPLAVDESFPQDLSLTDLESIPMLKAVIYKPTIQGGMSGCLALHAWALKKQISLVMSSSFESDLGLMHVAAIACRLSLSAPAGIGTYHYLKNYVCQFPLQFSSSMLSINTSLTPSSHE